MVMVQHLLVLVVALAFLAENGYKIIEFHLSKKSRHLSHCCVRKIQTLIDDVMHFHVE